MLGIVKPPGQARPKTAQPPVRRAAAWYREFQRFLLGNRSLRPFAELLGGEALLSQGDGEVLKRHFQVMGFLHRKRDPGLQNTLCQVLSAFGPPIETATPADPSTLDTLRRDGIADLPPMPEAALTAVRDHVAPLDLVPASAFRLPEGRTRPQPPQDLRQSENLGQVQRSQVLRLPGLLRMAADPELLSLVQAYLQAPAFLTDVSIWRSFAGDGSAKPAKEAQLFHIDLDNYRFCKVFVYLNDVDEAAGPHVFLPTSHRAEVITACRDAQLPDQQAAFDHWYYETLRKSDADVMRWTGLTPRVVTGPAGTRFIADTSALHRGSPPLERDRWVLQFVYGVTPATGWLDAGTPAYYRNWDGSPDRDRSPEGRHVMKLLMPDC